MQKRYMEEDGAKPAGKPSLGDFNSDSYSLHINGFVRDFGFVRYLGFVRDATRLSVGFGIAISRGKNDSLLFQMTRLLDDSTITALEAELIALKLGLSKAVSLGIKHISIYSDNYEVIELVMERSAPAHENMALLMNNVQRIRQQLTTSIPVFVVTRNKYAMESIDMCMPRSHNKTCGICFDEKMLYVVLCRHQFCVECVEQYIEVQLLEGKSVLKCPHYGCKSNLNLRNCPHLLTPKAKKLWERRIKQDSIPEWDRFHCPIPSCSAWMSKIKLFDSTELDGVKRCCTKCCEPFCIYCKVPWHSNLSCEEYKRSCPKPTTTVWRQCRSCQHMIEVLETHSAITCRCGYKFCDTCGAQWKLGSGCPHHLKFMKLLSIWIFFGILLIFGEVFAVLFFYLQKSKH